MNRKVKETMDITRFSTEELDETIGPLLQSGWHVLSGIDESIVTSETGLSIITYTRTLVKYEE